MPEENINHRLRYVVDASFVLALVLSDERVSQVDKIFGKYSRKQVSLFAPFILPFEVINSITMAVRRKRFSNNEGHIFIDQYLALTIPYMEISEKMMYEVASQFNLSAYDAAYVALAQKLDVPFLTLDDRLVRLTRGG